MREAAVALVCVLSWLAGALITSWDPLSRLAGTRPMRAELAVVGFWTMLMLVFGLPFHIRTVSILVGSQGNRWRRLARGAAWGAGVAIATAVLLVALLGRGRVSDLLTLEGQVLLVWSSAMTMIFAILGTIASRLGVWIEPRR